jgi:hypothetical protein
VTKPGLVPAIPLSSDPRPILKPPAKLLDRIPKIPSPADVKKKPVPASRPARPTPLPLDAHGERPEDD